MRSASGGLLVQRGGGTGDCSVPDVPVSGNQAAGFIGILPCPDFSYAPSSTPIITRPMAGPRKREVDMRSKLRHGRLLPCGRSSQERSAEQQLVLRTLLHSAWESCEAAPEGTLRGPAVPRHGSGTGMSEQRPRLKDGTGFPAQPQRRRISNWHNRSVPACETPFFARKSERRI